MLLIWKTAQSMVFAWGDPWNLRAEIEGIGFTVARDIDIWKRSSR